MVHLVILGLGSNIGDSKLNIEMAYESLKLEVGEILSKSSFYKSPPWGFEAEQDFVNSVVFMQTRHSPSELLARLKEIEKEMGRSAKLLNGYESRIIDIDILDYSGQCIEEDRLITPHPLMHERAFVLAPLMEILPNWEHPKFRKKMSSVLTAISDFQNIVLLK